MLYFALADCISFSPGFDLSTDNEAPPSLSEGIQAQLFAVVGEAYSNDPLLG